MVAKRFGLLVGLVLVLTACAVTHTSPVIRVALLAPFEGRYREVGYDVFYAVRLALVEGDYANVELLAIDDGGTVTSAVERARALVANPLVKVVLLAGYPATDPQTQSALANLPAIVIGDWEIERASDSVFVLANPSVKVQITTTPRIEILDAVALPEPVVGGEIFALKQFPRLREDLTGITIISSVSLADSAFAERYVASDLFVPPPGLLTTLAYDAAHIAAQAALTDDPIGSLTAVNYPGLNGTITFTDGYWANAPIHTYGYDENRRLTLVD